LREIATIHGKKFEYEYTQLDFSNIASLQAENKIPKEVKRYSLTQVS